MNFHWPTSSPFQFQFCSVFFFAYLALIRLSTVDAEFKIRMNVENFLIECRLQTLSGTSSGRYRYFPSSTREENINENHDNHNCFFFASVFWITRNVNSTTGKYLLFNRLIKNHCLSLSLCVSRSVFFSGILNGFCKWYATIVVYYSSKWKMSFHLNQSTNESSIDILLTIDILYTGHTDIQTMSVNGNVHLVRFQFK